MKDHNDFFDDMIDVDDDSETEIAEYLEEDGYEEEDEDEEYDSAIVRTAVLLKNDMLALLSLKTGDAGGQIVRYDPRERIPSMQSYNTETEATEWFTRSLATSRKNGWAVVYDGEPMIG